MSTRVALGDVVTIDRNTASTQECEQLPYLGLEHIEQGRGVISPSYRRVPQDLKATKFRFERTHVLYGKLRPNLNKVLSPDFDGVCSTEILPLLPLDKHITRKYLHYMLLSSQFVRWASNSVSGANLPRIDPDRLSEYEFCLPAISSQRRLSEILEKADRTRLLRRYGLTLGNDLLEATFLEMFGHPRSGCTRWACEQFGELGALDRGRSQHRPRNASHLYGGEYPFIQTGDVSNCQVYVRTHEQTYSEAGLKQSKLWPAGTLCITIAANIGKTGILSYPACFPDSVVGFMPGDRVRTEYVQFWLKFLQADLERTAPEVAQKNINLEILRDLRCPVPPLDLQTEFAMVVKRHQALVLSQEEGIRQCEHLFQGLLHRAFGEVV